MTNSILFVKMFTKDKQYKSIIYIFKYFVKSSSFHVFYHNITQTGKINVNKEVLFL